MKKFKIHKINFLIAPLFMALISCGKTDTNTNSAADKVTNNEEEPSEDPLGGEEDPRQKLLKAVKANKPQLFNTLLDEYPELKEDKPLLGEALLLAVEPHKDGKPSENGKLSQHKKYMVEILLRCLGDGPKSAKLMGKALVTLAKQKIHRDFGRDLVALTFAYNDMQNCGEDIGEALIEFCKKDDKNHFVCESVARLCENKIPYKKSFKAIEAALARKVKANHPYINLGELKLVNAVLNGIGRHNTVDFDTLSAFIYNEGDGKFLNRLKNQMLVDIVGRADVREEQNKVLAFKANTTSSYLTDLISKDSDQDDYRQYFRIPTNNGSKRLNEEQCMLLFGDLARCFVVQALMADKREDLKKAFSLEPHAPQNFDEEADLPGVRGFLYPDGGGKAIVGDAKVD